jgi:hypothetical protein
MVDLAFNDRLNAVIGGSLSTQEVRMAVQSIRTSVEIRHVAGNHLFVSPREMPFGEMYGVGKLHHLPQKVGARAKTFDDTWNLRSSGAGAPEVISLVHLAGRIGVFDNRNLGGGLGVCSFRACLLHPVGRKFANSAMSHEIPMRLDSSTPGKTLRAG